ncbi:MAG: GFA family protein [Pseudomonas sp.]|uniref:GFA family protein n=1 Tax=Pseudomonas sp. TaxID=306 RepID=UPI0033945F5B
MKYRVSCTCGTTTLAIVGEPRARNYCHCHSCRTLLDVEVFEGTAWDYSQVQIINGEAGLVAFAHPTKAMCRYHCGDCGSTVFHTDAFGMRCIAYALFRRANGGVLPEALQPNRHYFYSEQLRDFTDDLPKYLQAADGPLFE